jgi:hypothetical protein
MLKRSFFAVAVLSLISLPARADLLPEGQTYVPLTLTLDGQDAFKDTTFVILGCNSVDGRHQVAFASAKPSECKVKMFPTVYAIATKDKKPLEDLVAKDLGWAQEGIEAKKLLDKKPECGAIQEQTLVPKDQGITGVVAKYNLEKAADGKCSVKKVSSVQAKTAPPASASASVAPAASGSSAPASASASSAPATSASSSTPEKKSGGCNASSTNGGLGFALALGLGAAAVAAARRRRAG